MALPLDYLEIWTALLSVVKRKGRSPAPAVAEGDTVVIFGSEAGTVKSTGNSFRNVWSQKYVVRDGLIVEMSEYNIQLEPRE